MEEGYFPVVRELNPHNAVVENQNTDCMGGLRWKGEWGCFVFEPMLGVQLGPAFLTNLASHMIRMEAKLRKDLDKQPSTIDSPIKDPPQLSKGEKELQFNIDRLKELTQEDLERIAQENKDFAEFIEKSKRVNPELLRKVISKDPPPVNEGEKECPECRRRMENKANGFKDSEESFNKAEPTAENYVLAKDGTKCYRSHFEEIGEPFPGDSTEDPEALEGLKRELEVLQQKSDDLHKQEDEVNYPIKKEPETPPPIAEQEEDKIKCPSLRENEYCIGDKCGDTHCLRHPVQKDSKEE